MIPATEELVLTALLHGGRSNTDYDITLTGPIHLIYLSLKTAGRHPSNTLVELHTGRKRP